MLQRGAVRVQPVEVCAHLSGQRRKKGERLLAHRRLDDINIAKVLLPPPPHSGVALVLRDVRRGAHCLHAGLGQRPARIDLGTTLQERAPQRVVHELRHGKRRVDQLALLVGQPRDGDGKLLLEDVHEARRVLRAQLAQRVAQLDKLLCAEGRGCLGRRRRRRRHRHSATRRRGGGTVDVPRGCGWPSGCSRHRPPLRADHVHRLHREEL
mmetsp:Transcript_20665/g.57081  ORF Transcript_20665/g.57081 Transcript_20665/m.57081 type:complete len:210 (-) Transcript_20665:655-1284(-)